MAYSIDRYNSSGTSAIIVDDGTINTTLDLKLIGKNYAGYGEAQNENFLWLLENFSSRTAPPNAITGQLWYDSSIGKLKLNYSSGSWRTIAVNNVINDGVSPTGLTVGDFWWNTITEQLFCRSSGNRDVFIGGQTVANTQVKTVSVLDTNGNTHQILEAVVDNVVTCIISDTEFTLDSSNSITGFSVIYKGVTLNGVSNNLTTNLYKINGTSTDSDRLGGIASTDYINKISPIFDNTASFSNNGFTVGSNNRLSISIISGVPTIKNNISDTIEFKTTDNVSSQTVYSPMKLSTINILPGVDHNNVDIGSSVGLETNKFYNMWADSFNGMLNGHSTDVAATPSTIPVRTDSEGDYNGNTIGAGSIFASHFAGIAFLGTGGDVAEKYLADKTYEIGTVLMIGGEKEVTAAVSGKRAIGALSVNPSIIMNNTLVDGIMVALKGRVPVKVTGDVIKGDRLIATDTGLAKSLTSECASLVFAIALEDNVNKEDNIIEAIIL